LGYPKLTLRKTKGGDELQTTSKNRGGWSVKMLIKQGQRVMNGGGPSSSGVWGKNLKVMELE